MVKISDNYCRPLRVVSFFSTIVIFVFVVFAFIVQSVIPWFNFPDSNMAVPSTRGNEVI